MTSSPSRRASWLVFFTRTTYVVILILWLRGLPVHLAAVLFLFFCWWQWWWLLESVSLFFSTPFHHHFSYFWCPDFYILITTFFVTSWQRLHCSPVIWSHLVLPFYFAMFYYVASLACILAGIRPCFHVMCRGFFLSSLLGLSRSPTRFRAVS